MQDFYAIARDEGEGKVKAFDQPHSPSSPSLSSASSSLAAGASPARRSSSARVGVEGEEAGEDFVADGGGPEVAALVFVVVFGGPR